MALSGLTLCIRTIDGLYAAKVFTLGDYGYTFIRLKKRYVNSIFYYSSKIFDVNRGRHGCYQDDGYIEVLSVQVSHLWYKTVQRELVSYLFYTMILLRDFLLV